VALKIVIQTVPHAQQRYDTAGDWYYKPDGSWHINVSDMDNWRYEVLLAIHELCEMAQCVDKGISQVVVDKFDQEYESRRHEGDVTEPGDDINAPYAVQHCISTGIERLMAAQLGVSWSEYEKEIDALVR
jgi:hypothetical protein